MKGSNLQNEVESALFEVALSIEDPGALETFLERSLGSDPEAIGQMRRLIESSRNSTRYFLEARERRADLAAELVSNRSIASETAPPLPMEGPGTRFGDYLLISRIGEGSGGVIYEAEQERPIQRKVAVKILRAGMDTEAMIRRFRSERQALAMMDHPNIARVYDAGASSSGRPYFVMELVVGEKITDYCDRHRLNLTDRLHLFQQVCGAIEHAHQKGIIHRDIKSSNVLVTHTGGRHVPKVIDFGIAKAAYPADRDRTVITSHDHLFGTPAYMSPEQIDLAGLDVDTRSDIYSLGILLYSLLVGRTPLDPAELAQLGLSAMRDRVLKNQPEPPSKTLAQLDGAQLGSVARSRRAEPRNLASQIAGDLDWIVMKAIERTRARRYQTVDALAVDIGRFLNHQPVSARPPSRTYLLAKFIRRNRLACIAGASLVSLFIAAFAFTATLYKRERIALDEQRRLKFEAEAARREERKLRQQSDARANLGRVAFLLDQGRVAEADELWQHYPLTSIEPSLEAAAVFRALGDWNATHDRWDQALQCFRLLIQANRLEKPLKILEGADLLASGIALLECDKPEYVDFRNDIMERYLPSTSTPLGAEHLLKVCCAAPASDRIIRRLSGAAELIGDPEDAPYPSWAGLSLALYHYRAGDLETALSEAKTGLTKDYLKNSCAASLQALIALCEQGLHQPVLARAAVDRAKSITEESGEGDFVHGKPVESLWFDWSLASYLIAEAERELSPAKAMIPRTRVRSGEGR